MRRRRQKRTKRRARRQKRGGSRKRSMSMDVEEDGSRNLMPRMTDVDEYRELDPELAKERFNSIRAEDYELVRPKLVYDFKNYTPYLGQQPNGTEHVAYHYSNGQFNVMFLRVWPSKEWILYDDPEAGYMKKDVVNACRWFELPHSVNELYKAAFPWVEW